MEIHSELGAAPPGARLPRPARSRRADPHVHALFAERHFHEAPDDDVPAHRQPWQRPGPATEAQGWIRPQLDAAGLQIEEEAEQLKTQYTRKVLRTRATSADFAFKARASRGRRSEFASSILWPATQFGGIAERASLHFLHEGKAINMADVSDKDIAIWACPEAHEFKEWPYPLGPEPDRIICSECGQTYVTGCPSPECEDPVYHWSDVKTKFHKCGTRIPWAAALEEREKWDWPAPYSEMLAKQEQEEALRRYESASGNLTVAPSTGPVPEFRPPPATVSPLAMSVPQPSRAAETEARITREELKGLSVRLRKADGIVEKSERKAIRTVASFFGKSVSKGVEDFVSSAVKWVLVGLVIFVAALCGVRLAF